VDVKTLTGLAAKWANMVGTSVWVDPSELNGSVCNIKLERATGRMVKVRFAEKLCPRLVMNTGAARADRRTFFGSKANHALLCTGLNGDTFQLPDWSTTDEDSWKKKLVSLYPGALAQHRFELLDVDQDASLSLTKADLFTTSGPPEAFLHFTGEKTRYNDQLKVVSFVGSRPELFIPGGENGWFHMSTLQISSYVSSMWLELPEFVLVAGPREELLLSRDEALCVYIYLPNRREHKRPKYSHV
jgi:hypothetical protein